MIVAIRGTTYHVFRFTLAQRALWLCAESFTPFLILQIGETVETNDDIRQERRTWRVTEIVEAQATRPNDPKSDFIIGDQMVTVAELFQRLDQPGRLVCQTCIGREGEANWGRRFAIADPVGPSEAS